MAYISGLGTSDWLPVILLVISLTFIVSVVSAASSLTINVKDARTRENVGDALVYLDGGYIGTTTPGNGGKLVIDDVASKTHTIRVTKENYKEVTKKFVYPSESALEISLSKGPLVSLNANGPTANGINVVFYPSSTAYSCTDKKVIQTPVYMTDETRFRTDVESVIRQTYLELDKVTSPSNPLPAGFQDKFNFYYYYDPSAPADAFSGCAGSVPESYWKDVTFSDITVILYPSYTGLYSDASCQPTGCFQNFGPGRSLMKVPANQASLVRHETGHAVFELIDTYCGSTYYYENDPHANVWSSREACRSDATSNNRDPELCRQIEQKSIGTSAACIKDFWRWDPNPDIMAQGYGGKFGAAATQRINYVISKAEAG
jgi:hypothetical protein